MFPYLNGTVQIDAGAFGFSGTPGPNFQPLINRNGGGVWMGIYTDPIGLARSWS